MSEVRKLQPTALDTVYAEGTVLCDSTSLDNAIDQTDQKNVSKEYNQHQIQSRQTLHQTTQSLLIASSMLVSSTNNVGGGVDNNNGCYINNNNSAEIKIGNSRVQGNYSSENILGSTDSMNGHLFPMALNIAPTVLNQNAANGQLMNTMSNMKTVQINVHDLVIENESLREKLKEITADRDRLLCEVSNLRLELDMFELKRLPEEK